MKLPRPPDLSSSEVLGLPIQLPLYHSESQDFAPNLKISAFTLCGHYELTTGDRVQGLVKSSFHQGRTRLHQLKIVYTPRPSSGGCISPASRLVMPGLHQESRETKCYTVDANLEGVTMTAHASCDIPIASHRNNHTRLHVPASSAWS